MPKQLILICLILSVTIHSQAQTGAPPDVGNEALLNQQLHTAYKFAHSLETGQIDTTVAYIDPLVLRNQLSYRDTLIAYSLELSKLLDSTRLSIVTGWPEKKYNTYRCRYYNTKGEFFYIDLYMNVGQPNSTIQKIVKIPASVLKADRDALAKRLKENPHPPAPPKYPPPGVTIGGNQCCPLFLHHQSTAIATMPTAIQKKPRT